MQKKITKQKTKTKHSRKKQNNNKASFFFLLFLIALVPAIVSIYSISNKKQLSIESQKQTKEIKINNEITKKTNDFPKKENIKTPKEKTYLDKKIIILDENIAIQKEEITERNKKEAISSESIDYESTLKKSKKKISIKKTEKTTLPVKKYSGTPKLAIIIDDVAFFHEARSIKSIKYKITPSIFPPTPNHPETIEISNLFPFFMIHLPLEAVSHLKPEDNTLETTHSYLDIKKRIETVKKQFPRAVYYNNHTGSKFTANYKSMDYLFKVFKKNDLIFVDSRTVITTQAPKLAKKYNQHLYSRDVFLDNSINKKDIRNQLKKAVEIAKRRGKAIAIGHPHKNTLEVLNNAKDILKDVEVVYLKDL